MIAFDIETGPVSDDMLLAYVEPFKAPPHPGVFDPESVRHGRTKDPQKILAQTEEARQKHETAVAEYADFLARSQEEWWQNIKDKAALNPLTGQTLAIGYLSTDLGRMDLHITEETEMLTRFWSLYEKCREQNRIMVGHNILGFDVPFLLRRSWMLEVDIPAGVFDRGKYLDTKTFVDTFTLWAAGKFNEWISLDKLAKALGIQGKLEDVDGSMFAQLLKTDRAKAEAYLARDVETAALAATRMGIV